MEQATMSLQSQIDELRLVGESRTVALLAPCSALLAIAGFAAAAWADSQNLRVLCLFVAGCGSLVALAAFFGIQHVRNAASATRKGRREPATLVLSGDMGDQSESLRGVLTPSSRHAHAWEMQFAKCRGWAPSAGVLQVEAVYLSGIAWPVLLVHENGLLMPHAKPRSTAR